MRQFQAEVITNGPAMEGVNLMWLRGPEVANEASPEQFRRFGSARRLYHFHIDNAGDY